MSQEDVRSTTSLVAERSASKHCNGHSLIQGPDQDLEGQSQGQDGIVLERFASLSLDMFDPSDFTGRFTKVQSRSRKRTRIIGGRWGFSFVVTVNVTRRRDPESESVACSRPLE